MDTTSHSVSVYFKTYNFKGKHYNNRNGKGGQLTHIYQVIPVLNS